MIKVAVIRESNSLYTSPVDVVVVKKKDGTNRVCVDYRHLNRLIVFDPEPMPTADNPFQKLSDDEHFLKIDLSDSGRFLYRKRVFLTLPSLRKTDHVSSIVARLSTMPSAERGGIRQSFTLCNSTTSQCAEPF